MMTIQEKMALLRIATGYTLSPRGCLTCFDSLYEEELRRMEQQGDMVNYRRCYLEWSGCHYKNLVGVSKILELIDVSFKDLNEACEAANQEARFGTNGISGCITVDKFLPIVEKLLTLKSES